MDNDREAIDAFDKKLEAIAHKIAWGIIKLFGVPALLICSYFISTIVIFFTTTGTGQHMFFKDVSPESLVMWLFYPSAIGILLFSIFRMFSLTSRGNVCFILLALVPLLALSLLLFFMFFGGAILVLFYN